MYDVQSSVIFIQIFFQILKIAFFVIIISKLINLMYIVQTLVSAYMLVTVLKLLLKRYHQADITNG